MIGLDRGTFPLSGLRAFDAAARLGSFRAAADALGVTPSAVSRQIKAGYARRVDPSTGAAVVLDDRGRPSRAALGRQPRRR